MKRLWQISLIVGLAVGMPLKALIPKENVEANRDVNFIERLLQKAGIIGTPSSKSKARTIPLVATKAKGKTLPQKAVHQPHTPVDKKSTSAELHWDLPPEGGRIERSLFYRNNDGTSKALKASNRPKKPYIKP